MKIKRIPTPTFGQHFRIRHFGVLVSAAAAVLLTGCLANMPTVPALGQNNPSTTAGAVAGGNTQGANETLERCPAPLGVLRIEEDSNSDWYRYYGSRLGSTTPLLSLMIQQSNCFVVVERGTGERSLKEETDRGRGGEARESGTRGKGQQVIADFLLVPEIVLSSQGNQGGSLSGIGKLLPGGLSGLAGQIGVSSGEASTVLRIVDIRSSVRLAAAEGYSKNKSFSFNGMVIVSSGGVGASGYSRTDEGRLISAAFFDAYKKMVVALREYKAQTVKGGLGEGGLLGVQGGITPASKALDTKPKPTPTPVPNPAPKK